MRNAAFVFLGLSSILITVTSAHAGRRYRAAQPQYFRPFETVVPKGASLEYIINHGRNLPPYEVQLKPLPTDAPRHIREMHDQIEMSIQRMK